jgi:hypothetical protein
VINGHQIYNLVRNQPIVIDMPTNPTRMVITARMVITDGYHITPPLELVYTVKPVRYFTIACAIEDAQLLVGFIMTMIVYAMGLTSGILFLQLLSTVPVFYFLFIYYIRREAFIRIRPV